jgi:type I restriction enzyme S subunit
VELVGKTALVREPLEAAFSNHITLLRSDTTKAEGAWIALALQALWRQGFFANLCNKWIGQAGINTETLKSVLIPLPPLSEQRRIVAHLQAVQEKIQALKETQAATEAELKRLEQAILEKAFRGEL